jgi:hypothetical protein
MNPFIQITHLTDKGRETLTFDISEDQRQQIMLLLMKTFKAETTIPEELLTPPILHTYDELEHYKSYKSIFVLYFSSSNDNPHYKETKRFYLSYKDAVDAFNNSYMPIGQKRTMSAHHVDKKYKDRQFTLNQWFESSSHSTPILEKTNRGDKLSDNNIIVVVNHDNHIEDIRPPFKTEKYKDDLIDYTECFQRHVVPSHIDHGSREDIITYALSLVGIQPDGEGFEVSKLVLLNSMMHKNFPE